MHYDLTELGLNCKNPLIGWALTSFYDLGEGGGVIVLDSDPNYISNVVGTLWGDPAFQVVVNQSRELVLIDSVIEWLDAIDRIIQDDYIPTVEDIARVGGALVGRTVRVTAGDAKPNSIQAIEDPISVTAVSICATLTVRLNFL
jgi:hypothetical protein